MSAPTRARLPSSIAAERKFRTRIAELGGHVNGEYVDGRTPVPCLCPARHPCSPRPYKVNSGRGMCRTCVGQDPSAAWAAFRRRIEELGGEVLEAEWRGSAAPHAVRCANGHFSTPLPCNIAKGQGCCRRCAGQDPARAENVFRRRITEAGGRVLGPYINCDTPVRVMCALGHESTPTPYRATRGVTCTACAGLSPAAGEAAFRARVAVLGGTVVGPYVNSLTRVPCICPAGHPCQPTPTYLRKGNGMCPVCARNDPGTSRRRFYDRVSAIGGSVVGPYINNRTPIQCVCREGHACRPRPDSLALGQGLCAKCAGRGWDALYVVVNPELGRVKFGITSGDPRARLGNHRRTGYVSVVRVLPDFPEAQALEMHVRTALREAGIAAVQGREYFHIDALAVVLDVVDGWTAA